MEARVPVEDSGRICLLLSFTTCFAMSIIRPLGQISGNSVRLAGKVGAVQLRTGGEMRRSFQVLMALLAVCWLSTGAAFAQGGGASTTGSINGKVADSSGGILPGVTVTVTGDSPVIDTSNTRVQQNFKLEALQGIPNSRDLWSLLAATPSVTMDRLDVGGDRAGTQSGYTAYGYSCQNRVLVEGINTTEGTSGAGFYVDYGSFEEVFLGTVGQGAEMPTPGVQSQMLGKSGGNKFQGEIYQDYENNSLQSANIPADVLAK